MESESINMIYKYEKSSLIIKLHLYFRKSEVNDYKTIRIFHPYFVKRNKYKYRYKIIINNKLYSLTDKYQISYENTKNLKIKLVVNDKKIYFSYMLYGYKSLKNFNLLSNEKEILEKVDKEQNVNKYSESIHVNNSEDLDNKLNSNFKNKNNNSEIIERAIKIFSKNNYLNKNNGNEDRDSIINLSHDFLAPSYSTIELLYENSDFEYCSSNENSFILNNSGKKGYLDKIIATNLSYMFYGCSSLLYINGLSKINTINVTKLSNMFKDCSSLKKILWYI